MSILKEGYNVIIEATIANGGSLSPAVDMGGMALVGIQMPAAWTAATITLQTSDDNSTFRNVHNTAGEVDLTVSASIQLMLAGLEGLSRYIKVRSGTTATPVNQGAERVIGLVCRPS